ncbi:hypothetical protein DFH09DRAFT_1068725 [Mycena vulgaris]|nr:hypothetical protein DFH09DRAFT_1068725 [Mycena vulgaris]
MQQEPASFRDRIRDLRKTRRCLNDTLKNVDDNSVVFHALERNIHAFQRPEALHVCLCHNPVREHDPHDLQARTRFEHPHQQRVAEHLPAEAVQLHADPLPANQPEGGEIFRVLAEEADYALPSGISITPRHGYFERQRYSINIGALEVQLHQMELGFHLVQRAREGRLERGVIARHSPPLRADLRKLCNDAVPDGESLLRCRCHKNGDQGIGRNAADRVRLQEEKQRKGYYYRPPNDTAPRSGKKVDAVRASGSIP